MITDKRSQKVAEVSSGKSKTAEMVWWFAKSNEQYRIRGDLIFVGSGDFEYDGDSKLAAARKEQWGNLTDAARESFFKMPVPGQAYEAENAVPEGGRDTEGTLLPPPDNFLLMLVRPSHVDYLRLGNMYRQLDWLDKDVWTKARVNP
jgi:pyridoxamine 5'-phosphate oxidase